MFGEKLDDNDLACNSLDGVPIHTSQLDANEFSRGICKFYIFKPTQNHSQCISFLVIKINDTFIQ